MTRNSSNYDEFVYCTECGEVFDHMDLLVDHHAHEHRTFDESMNVVITADCEK